MLGENFSGTCFWRVARNTEKRPVKTVVTGIKSGTSNNVALVAEGRVVESLLAIIMF